jgi:nucleoid DNA-binding protein
MSSPAKPIKPKPSPRKSAVGPNTQARQPVKIPQITPSTPSDGPNPDGPRPVIIGPVMRKKELIDLVVERSGIKKKDAKPVIEAMLSVLGEALSDSRELNLLPMGKMMRVKVRQVNTIPAPRMGAAIDTDSSDS